MKPEGFFEAPGFAFLVYHNTYFEGKRGGLEVFLHGRRIIDAGEIVALTTPGRFLDFEAKETGKRIVDTRKGLSIIPEKIKPLDLSYQLTCRTDGTSIFINLSTDKPVDWTKLRSLGLKLEIYPKEYAYKTYQAGGTSGYFPERFTGKTLLVSHAREIRVAPEDGLRSFTLSSEDSVLSLTDEREMSENGRFVVMASLPLHSAQQHLTLKLTPKIDPNWRREPVIQVSQVGYHPDQKKMAVLELDSRKKKIEEMRLLSPEEDGSKRIVKAARPVSWGHLFDYDDHVFDFSEIHKSGLYYLQYENEEAGPIAIRNDVYREAWCPTLDVFFPVQMCHVDVRQGYKIWHGACHLDDALQAPPNQVHFDSYRQKADPETQYKANEHIPGLDWGGWHDAGDFDLPSGSICSTVLWLALAQEEFAVQRDVTSLRREERRVDLFQPDGKNDLLQQVTFGMEFLLRLYRALGHIGAGVIENNSRDYGLVGDPANITDGLVYDPALKPAEKKNGRSGKFDDRWVFTNRNTGGQYQLAQVAAVASRVLKGFDQSLAEDCLKTAIEVWEFEQTHPRVDFEVSYQPQEDTSHSWELAATAELFLTTGEQRFRGRLAELTPFIQKMPASTFWNLAGFTLARAAAKIENGDFKRAVKNKSLELKSEMEREFSKSPYGVFFEFEIWGNNWDVLDLGARSYYFIKHFPDLFSKDYLFSAINYNFGCHPATNHSYVSGVGVRSATVGYGFNRSEVTYIPGGVVSGASFLRPKFIEYRAGEWDWYETEYVIGGAAAYIFDALAVDSLLNNK